MSAGHRHSQELAVRAIEVGDDDLTLREDRHRHGEAEFFRLEFGSPVRALLGVAELRNQLTIGVELGDRGDERPIVRERIATDVDVAS